MEIKIKAYAYTIDIITEIRYFCKCNNAVFGKFRIIFTCAISKTDCSLHHNFHALFKISGNGKFVCTAVLPPRPSHNLRKSTPHPRPAPPHQPFQKPHYPLLCIITLAFRNANICMCLFRIRTIPLAFRRGGACVKSNMVYTLCKHMVYMLSITNEHKNELEMRAKPEWKVHFLCFASAKRGSFSIR